MFLPPCAPCFAFYLLLPDFLSSASARFSLPERLPQHSREEADGKPTLFPIHLDPDPRALPRLPTPPLPPLSPPPPPPSSSSCSFRPCATRRPSPATRRHTARHGPGRERGSGCGRCQASVCCERQGAENPLVVCVPLSTATAANGSHFPPAHLQGRRNARAPRT